MKFRIPMGPANPSVEKLDVIELDKERELRDLRKKVTELETRLSVREGRPIAGIVMRDRSQETHGYQCGFHTQVTVSDEAPEIECSVCGTKLDPIEVLREFASRERNFIWGIDAMIKEEKLLKASVEALKREKKNLSASVRRLGGKPTVIAQNAEMKVRFGRDE